MIDWLIHKLLPMCHKESMGYTCQHREGECL